MTQKLITYNDEIKTIEGNRQLRAILLNHKFVSLHRGLLIPDDLIAELEQFSSRNKLIPDRAAGRVKTRCCVRCLKAHALLKAKSLGLDEESIDLIMNIFNCETGHNGYYIDEDELIRI